MVRDGERWSQLPFRLSIPSLSFFFSSYISFRLLSLCSSLYSSPFQHVTLLHLSSSCSTLILSLHLFPSRCQSILLSFVSHYLLFHPTEESQSHIFLLNITCLLICPVPPSLLTPSTILKPFISFRIFSLSSWIFLPPYLRCSQGLFSPIFSCSLPYFYCTFPTLHFPSYFLSPFSPPNSTVSPPLSNPLLMLRTKIPIILSSAVLLYPTPSSLPHYAPAPLHRSSLPIPATTPRPLTRTGGNEPQNIKQHQTISITLGIH